MKTLTCRELGGTCDEKMTASTWEEMKSKGMEHLKQVHPEMAADVEKTPKDDPKMVGWEQQSKAKFDAASEM